MTTYVVYEEADARRLSPAERVEALMLVKDGFSWRAFLFSGIWLAARGLWGALALWAATLAVLGGGVWLVGLGPLAVIFVWIALALVVGFEASSLLRDQLEGEACQELGLVAGGARSDCETVAVAKLKSAIENERQQTSSIDA
ncbi:MAG: DUF2628 domain-containing protein [Hyphomicrobiaceae bacterium]